VRRAATGRGAGALICVSVPERGFVALIPKPNGQRSAERQANAAKKSFSPRAGIRGFDTSGTATAYKSDCSTPTRFSPRAGIRGFDTNRDQRQVWPTRGEHVSVPERGFVALILSDDPVEEIAEDGTFQSPSGDSWL
jgi:hypothetical protein